MPDASEVTGTAVPAAAMPPDLFRDAMAHLAGGTAIIACQDGDRPHGILVSSLIALSVEPPRMLFCVRRQASAHAALRRARVVSLSVLAAGHRREAERFSRSDRAGERFDPDAWRLDPAGPPELVDALVSLRGRVARAVNAGSHTVFVVDIDRASVRPDDPLVYFDRRLRTFARHQTP